MRIRVPIIVVAAVLALSSCAGIGTVSQSDLTTEVQGRGGGITTGLVDAAIEAVADETNQDPLPVHSITATLAQVTIVVPSGGSAAGAGRREAWTYGTSGLYGGRGLTGPSAAVGATGGGAFPVGPGALDVDAAAATARDAVGPGTWVQSVTVIRPSEGADPSVSVAVTDGSVTATVVVDATGAIVVEGSR